MVYTNLTDLIGHTPLLKLHAVEGQKADILVKLESFNPGGSVKDRVALSMIADAEEKGLLAPGATLIEPTSGNTGVGLAWVGIAKGYKVILTMPETMSQERRNLLRAYGAELVLTPGAEGMKGAIEKAQALRDSIPGSERTTGEEIWADTEGKLDVLVAGVGTGGTLSGTGKALKKHRADIQVVAVEPATSAVLSTGMAGKHKIQGIGAGFVPKTYNSSVVDRILPIADDTAIAAARMLAQNEGLLVGISSGAAYAGALALAREDAYAGKTIVAVLPDTGERYLSTVLFDYQNYPLQ